MGILARLRLAKIRTMARPNSPDMPPKRTKKVRLGIKSEVSLRAAILNNYPTPFTTLSVLADTDRIMIASNLENVSHDV